MTEKRAVGQCRDCRFCRQIGEALHCVRNAPTFDPTTGQARWPIIQPTDYCGDFCPTGRNREASLVEREVSLVKRESQEPTDGQSRRNAASAPNHPSSIIHNQCPSPNRKSSIVNRKSQIGLPICVDVFGPYCEIPLTQNRVAKVDPADYIWLSQFRWCCKVGRDRCYAIRHIQDHGRTKRIHMHRQIMDTADDMICDHINHDGLDNRRDNLRNCTLEQNNANRRSSPNATSPYIGVSYCRKREKWVAYIKHRGRSRFLGQFDQPEDAARAHDKAAWELWGEFANLNFPNDYPDHPAARHDGCDSCPVTRDPQEKQSGRGGKSEIRSTKSQTDSKSK